MTIDDAVRARAGERLRMTIWPIKGGYQANVSTDGVSWTVAMDTTPDAALRKALNVTSDLSDLLV